MSKTSETLSDELLAVLDRQDLQELYFGLVEPNRQEQFRFTAYIFLIITSLIVASNHRNTFQPKTIADCHKRMFLWWGHDRLVRCGDFISSPTELLKLAVILEDKNRPWVRDDLSKTTLHLSDLVRACLLIRTELYGEALNSANTTIEQKITLLANISQTLITGVACAEDESGPNPHLQGFKVLTLSEIFKEYLNAVSRIFQDE